MLSALLRPFSRGEQRHHDDAAADLEHDPPARPLLYDYRQHRHATADFTEADDDDEDDSNNGEPSRGRGGHRTEEDEDGLAQSVGVLPLFSAGHLDSLPIYSMTHAIRIIVQARTETTLTWEQLRSPQVSQFLIRPMQQQIRNQHFSRGTLYALMANCLQFEKEAQVYPGNSGTSSTRAKVCELLATKLLKEYTTRELIDALSYDFYPLQGIPGSQTPLATGGKPMPATLRTSTLEVAIRASAKHFLSHPLVVQQVEAIWNGAISFHSSSNPLHRPGSISSSLPSGGNQSRRQSTIRTPLLSGQHAKEEPSRSQSWVPGRRAVTLYDPRTASLFKLSRLRVPRYRQILSTCSLFILICLFLAVLSQRSSRFTSLELIFWFWSAGFMLDEIVGFNEQGLSLYIMSFWNIFDLGILVLLIVYYCMRIYGVFLLDPHKWNQNAYDVLAANAILLLPRIFSVLDHYPYFSQLLIAFRLMAIDLAAVFVLIFVCCSGFLVFFTLSNNTHDPYVMAYKIFQILMGFTPAAWEVWPSYNWMGKALMALFIIICHFVIVTILITVLTNSFMSIASNANEEHQYLFAVNTISMVKNDALFLYVAPANIVAWFLMPLRYCMSLNQFVWLNRVAIKATHFPLLFCIFIYEKYFLAPCFYEATDLVENPGRGRQRITSFADPSSRSAFFSPGARVREESVLGYQKDRALEEVFRRVPDFATLRTQRRNERRKTQNAIRTWMDQNDGAFHSPQNYSTINARIAPEWQRRPSIPLERPSRFPRRFSDVRSAASDPADFMAEGPHLRPPDFHRDGVIRRDYAMMDAKDNTDADGDDELVTNDEDDGDDATNNMDDRRRASESAVTEDYFTTPVTARFTNVELGPGEHSGYPSQRNPISPRPSTSRRLALHSRTLSTNTILYAPEDFDRPRSSSSASMIEPMAHPRSRPLSNRHTPVSTPISGGGGRRSPRRSLHMTSTNPRPIVQPRDLARTAPSRSLTLDIPLRKDTSQHQSPSEMGSGSAGLTAEDDALSGVPSSFATQMAMASAMLSKSAQGDNNRMSRLMLAKMKTLEESLGDVVREMREMRSSVPNTAYNSDDGGSGFKRLGTASAATSGPASMGEGLTMMDKGLRRSMTAPRRIGRREGSRRSPISSTWRSKETIAASGSGEKGKGKGKEVSTKEWPPPAAGPSGSRQERQQEDGEENPFGEMSPESFEGPGMAGKMAGK